MTPATTSVFEAIKEFDALTEKLSPTDWIVIDRPLRTCVTTTRILRKGIMVRVTDGSLADCSEEIMPTHVIIAMRNNIHNTAFEIDCEEIGRERLTTIKL